MVKKWIKIIQKIPNKKELNIVIDSILSWDIQHLDIERLAGKKWYFRCRVWKIRIIFFQDIENQYYISSIGYRWDVYNNF